MKTKIVLFNKTSRRYNSQKTEQITKQKNQN